MGSMFYSCQTITELDLSNWDVSNVTDFEHGDCGMFESCTSLTSLDLSNWDVSNATNMKYMFYGCTSLTSLDLSNWHLNTAVDQSKMFYNTPELKYVGMLYSDKISIELIKTYLIYLYEGSSTRYIYTLDIPAHEIVSTKYLKVVDYRRTSQTIRLPQPLRARNGVKDRLYWDENKGKYCIEKCISDEGEILDSPIIIDLDDYTELISLPSYNPITCVYTNDPNVQSYDMTVQIPFR